ncbi:hypothetical protein [Paenibacillus sp. 1P03SA]|uniref:hypothetical protein n=1 Tax=Paenibacillus sp. 1P03SA TaxID=3132294 RepID=UPI0039A34FBC
MITTQLEKGKPFPNPVPGTPGKQRHGDGNGGMQTRKTVVESGQRPVFRFEFRKHFHNQQLDVRMERPHFLNGKEQVERNGDDVVNHDRIAERVEKAVFFLIRINQDRHDHEAGKYDHIKNTRNQSDGVVIEQVLETRDEVSFEPMYFCREIGRVVHFGFNPKLDFIEKENRHDRRKMKEKLPLCEKVLYECSCNEKRIFPQRQIQENVDGNHNIYGCVGHGL